MLSMFVCYTFLVLIEHQQPVEIECDNQRAGSRPQASHVKLADTLRELVCAGKFRKDELLGVEVRRLIWCTKLRPKRTYF
jgi:hypothetical protein